jgi:membrane protease YdiL (CAAX protease family)
MPEPYSLDPDDDLPLVADNEPERVFCRRCGDPVAEWQFSCPSCGLPLNSARSRNRAVPIAPPDSDVPYAEEVDDVDPFDAPVADVVTDRFGVPITPRPRRRRRRPPKKPSVGWQRLLPMFVGYAVMMAITIAFAILMFAKVLTDGSMEEDTLYWAMFAVEGIDAILVLLVALAVGRMPWTPKDLTHKLGTWILGFPLLAFLLVLNIGFVLFVRKVFNVEPELGPPITIITVLLICVQPALIEEWFFRHLALGSLREKVGTNWAVWISGAMFAAAHITNIPGMPYLLLLGVTLGYLRIHSGGLALPMLLHFLHNFAVLLANRMM